MKTCSRCNQQKPATLEYFGKFKDGLQAWCKPCRTEYQAEYRQTPAGKATTAKYNKSEKSRAKNKRYKQSEKGKTTNARYDHSDKGKMMYRLAAACRRARIKENGVEEFSYEDLRIFWLGQNILDDRCYYCLKSLPDGPEHIDHYIPVAKGGSHTKVNLRPSCADCNLKKRDKDPIDFKNGDE